MKVFGIFGDPIEHSLSPAMQNAAFRALGIKAYYLPFRVTKDMLKSAILGAAAMRFGGLNLTIPHKETVLEIAQPDDLAKAIGAANTICFGQEITAHNTDGAGAVMALEEKGVKIEGSKVLLLGAGGASRAIAYTLTRREADLIIANRNPKRAMELAGYVGARGYGLEMLYELVPRSEIIINATSVGMKKGDHRLFDGHLLHEGQVVFDVVYNRETEIVQDAKERGAVAIDGVMMLVYQGAKALEMWTGKKAPIGVMEKAVRDGLRARGLSMDLESKAEQQ